MFILIRKDRLLKLEAQVIRNTHEIAENRKAINKIHRRDNTEDKNPKLTPHWYKIGGTV